MGDGLFAFLMLGGLLLGGAWSYWVVARALRTNRWAARILAALLSLGGMLGGFLLAGGLTPTPQGSMVMAVAGLLVLSPYAYVAWRTRRRNQAEAKVSAAHTSAPDFSAPPSATADSPAPTPAVAPIVPELFHLVASPAGATQPGAAARSTSNPLPHRYRFTYQGFSGEEGQRTVLVQSIGENGANTYLEGRCEQARAPRTFRTDRISGQLVDMDTGELLQVHELLALVPERSYVDVSPPTSSRPKVQEWRNAVLFTGFPQKRRDELEEMAEAAGWLVRGSVGPTLDYMVTGPKAGTSKLAQAQEHGTIVVGEDDFLAMLHS
ncbi:MULTISPECIES: BRCT domain-containing protein [Delftia]|uniref:BRCT domain-containing protein n=1 Tax=Delftia TaxID=80865 RepID=UPI001EDE2F2F|nr:MULTISPECIES: BRCT domain-containing protein [Delftia]MCG3785714.1 WYL domain-containing protein [Delftia acidovorans]